MALKTKPPRTEYVTLYSLEDGAIDVSMNKVNGKDVCASDLESYRKYLDVKYLTIVDGEVPTTFSVEVPSSTDRAELNMKAYGKATEANADASGAAIGTAQCLLLFTHCTRTITDLYVGDILVNVESQPNGRWNKMEDKVLDKVGLDPAFEIGLYIRRLSDGEYGDAYGLDLGK